MSAKRFRVAFSFAGEKRDFVEQVADILSERFGEDDWGGLSLHLVVAFRLGG